MIALRFPSFVDKNNITKIAEYEETGIEQNRFICAVKSAFQFRDHSTLAQYLDCLPILNRYSQIDVIGQCLDYLSDLARIH